LKVACVSMRWNMCPAISLSFLGPLPLHFCEVLVKLCSYLKKLRNF